MIFTPMSVRTPEFSICIRFMMGWVQPSETPGILSFPDSSSIMSALVNPGLHCSFGFSMYQGLEHADRSRVRGGIGAPDLPSTWSTSGTVFIIASCTVISRFASVIDTGGRVVGM